MSASGAGMAVARKAVAVVMPRPFSRVKTSATWSRGATHRLHYLMGDYSAHVLDRARQEIGQHREHTSGLVLEATRLSGSVGFLAGKAFLDYISNEYDNLPTDEGASIRGRNYLVEGRSYHPAADAEATAPRFGVPPAQLPAPCI